MAPVARAPTARPRVSTRIRRTTSRQGPRPPMHLVERMQVAVIGLVNAYIDRLMREIEPALRQRFDAQSHFPVAEVGGQVALGEKFLETTFHLVDRQAANDLARVIPVPTDAVLPNAGKLQRDWVHTNTELIRLEARAREEVRKVIEGPLREGIRVEEVRARIQERLGVVRSRAELIARDQTLKLYGQIQEARQTAAGIEEYTWSTSEDERVRPRHQELDGTTQRWDSPPVVDERSGRRASPGGDFQCRCAAIPILPSEGLSEQESPPEPAPVAPPEPEFIPAPEAPANETELPPEVRAPEPPRAPQPALPEPLRIAPEARATVELRSQEALAQHLASRGTVVALPDDALGKLTKVLGQHPTRAELDAILGHEGLASIGGPRSIEVQVLPGRVRTTMAVVGRGVPEEPEVRLVRTFRRSGGKLVVHHDLFQMSKRLQGGQIGPRVIAAQLAAYEALGVARIDLDAAWVGRYYWPKLGFAIRDKQEVQRYVGLFRGYLEKKGLGPEVVSKLTRGMTTMQQIATTRIGTAPLGKDFLMGEPINPLEPNGKRHPAAAGHLIQGLEIDVKPGDPVYDRMKREVSK